MSAAEKQTSCAGCGKVFDSRNHGTLYNDVVGKVCYGRGYRPSQVCATKAMMKGKKCPGCGTEGIKLGYICNECKAMIAKAKELQGAFDFEWWSVAPKRLGPYLGSSDDPAQERLDFSAQQAPLEQLAKLLVEALASGRTVTQRHERPQETVVGMTPERGRGDMGDDTYVYVELRKGQGPAFAALCEKIKYVMRLQYRHGFRNGSDLLRRVAQGDMSVRDFDLRLASEASDFGDVEGRAQRKAKR